jgi:hypothetical protein
VLGPLLALALVAEPVPPGITGAPPPSPPPADAPVEDETAYLPEPHEPRLELLAWGGQALSERGAGTNSQVYGAEAVWRFDSLDLGAFGGGYQLRHDVGGTVETYFAPFCLARIGQRFETRNGVVANFVFGVGAIHAGAWQAMFQVALGARFDLGPLFVAGELAFENDFVRLGLGLGVSLL